MTAGKKKDTSEGIEVEIDTRIGGGGTLFKRQHRCQDSSMVRFLRIDPMVSGSSPTSAKLSLRVKRVASPLYFQA